MDGFHDNKWFVYINDHHEGPFSMAQLQTKLETGELQRSQYVWREGMVDWQLMTSVQDLEEILTPHTDRGARSGATARDQLGFELGFHREATQQPDLFSLHLGDDSDPLLSEPSAMTIKMGLTPPVPNAPSPSAPSSSVPEFHATPAAAPTATPITEKIAEQIGEVPVPKLETTKPSEPSLDLSSPDLAHEDGPTSTTKPAGIWKVFLVLGLISCGAYAYVSGAMDGLLGRSSVASAPNGLLTQVAQRIPQLQNWISPIPEIPGVSREDLQALRENSKGRGAPQLALVVSQASAEAPTFFASARLPSGTKIELVLAGVEETLLSPAIAPIRATAELQNRLVEFTAVRQADGRALPQGRYRVLIASAIDQPPQIAQVLSALPEVQQPVQQPVSATSNATSSEPALVTGSRKLWIEKTLFLGGTEDATYQSRLKEAQERMRARSQEELKELSQLGETLSQQLTSSNEAFDKHLSGKEKKKSEKRWNEFHERWTVAQSKLDSTFAGWAETLSRKEFFHSSLYTGVQAVAEKIAQVHVQQHSFIASPTEDRSASTQELAKQVQVAKAGLSALQSKLQEVVTANASRTEGIPQRVVLDLSALFLTTQ
ncbi:MAG: domain 2 [Pseudomonadota bacterium]|jgi:hypothetical protein